MTQESQAVRVLVLGAHPDDAEFHAGGLLTLHVRSGNVVRIVSVTNGAAGHHLLSADQLKQTRQQEADAVRRISGFEYEIWDFPDGELMPTLELRRQVIVAIRSFQPDVVLTHRTCDYHPDHRAVGQAVQDASYMVTVPRMVPEIPALRRDPVVAYMNDLFSRPAPLRPDVLLNVTSLVDDIVKLLDCHQSQVYEWLPYLLDQTASVPDDPQSRLRWLRSWFEFRPAAIANRFRQELTRCLGDAAQQVRFAEAYEISEYARPLAPDVRERLFPQAVFPS